MSSDQPYLFCYRSRAQLPFAPGYMYICKPNCPLEAIRPSGYYDMYYCEYEAKLFNLIASAYQYAHDRHTLVDLSTNRIGMILNEGGERCIMNEIGCRKDRYYVSFTFDRDTIYAFTDNLKEFETTFHVAITRVPFQWRPRDVLAAMLSEAYSDVAKDVSTVITVSSIQSGIRGNVGRIAKTTAYINDAIAQLVTSCASKDSTWLSRWVRFAACGSFVPLFMVRQWINTLRKCEQVQDWDCVYSVRLDMEDAISEMLR